jgi:hypothetical protein
MESSLVDDLVQDMVSRRAVSAEALNTMHAARDGHPLGKNNAWRYRNALFTYAAYFGNGYSSAYQALKRAAENEAKLAA